MARTGRKAEMRHVSFNMPVDVHLDYITVAQSRGVDLSAVLNWVLAEFRPTLLLRHAQHMAAMIRVSAAGLPQSETASLDSQEALARAKEMMAQLQEMASKLAGQASERQRREAG
jgi:hypothetical protein